MMTELQSGRSWNPAKMMWSTKEDKINTSITINPRLQKYTAKEFISNIPEMFKKFNLNNLADCKMIVAACEEPVRVFSLHNKMGTINSWGHKANPTDNRCTPFQLIEIGNCRRPMLSISDASFTDEQRKDLRTVYNSNRCIF